MPTAHELGGLGDPQANLVRPGNYTLTASLSGYASATVSFTCDLGVRLRGAADRAAATRQPRDLHRGRQRGDDATTRSSSCPATAPTPVTQTAPPGSAPGHVQQPDPGRPTRCASRPPVMPSAAPEPTSRSPCADGATTISIAAGTQSQCVATLNARGAIVGATQAVFGASVTQALGNVQLTATYCSAQRHHRGRLPGKRLAVGLHRDQQQHRPVPDHRHQLATAWPPGPGGGPVRGRATPPSSASTSRSPPATPTRPGAAARCQQGEPQRSGWPTPARTPRRTWSRTATLVLSSADGSQASITRRAGRDRRQPYGAVSARSSRPRTPCRSAARTSRP